VNGEEGTKSNEIIELGEAFIQRAKKDNRNEAIMPGFRTIINALAYKVRSTT
jgi:hypothetical protein